MILETAQTSAWSFVAVPEQAQGFGDGEGADAGVERAGHGEIAAQHASASVGFRGHARPVFPTHVHQSSLRIDRPNLLQNNWDCTFKPNSFVFSLGIVNPHPTLDKFDRDCRYRS